MTHSERITTSARQTRSLAARFVHSLPADAIVFLEGPLGAGKTVFVKGMASGLGLETRKVHSPSFLLMHDYGGLIHVDCYRLQTARMSDLREAGILEALEGPGIKAVEWAPATLITKHPGATKIRIDFFSEKCRKIRITNAD
jgi:tRNA threonylcarbamoyladenosine biosynthesis protein TsaE